MQIEVSVQEEWWHNAGNPADSLKQEDAFKYLEFTAKLEDDLDAISRSELDNFEI